MLNTIVECWPTNNYNCTITLPLRHSQSYLITNVTVQLLNHKRQFSLVSFLYNNVVFTYTSFNYQGNSKCILGCHNNERLFSNKPQCFQVTLFTLKSCKRNFETLSLQLGLGNNPTARSLNKWECDAMMQTFSINNTWI